MSSSLYGPGGASIVIPNGPAPDYMQSIQNDPFYKQQLEWMQEDAATQRQRLLRDQGLASQLYNINVAQASASANSGGDYGMAAAQANAELQKKVAARENTQKEEYIREALASRGMYSSGQRPLEQANREFDYTTMLQGIDNDLSARAAAAAQARSQAQAGLALQLQEMQARYNAGQQDYSDSLSDLDRGLSRGRGEAAMSTYERLWKTGALNAPTMMAQWDPASGMYRTADGRYFDANGNPTSYSPQSSQPAYQQQSAYVPGSGVITEYPDSRPATNPIGTSRYAV